MVDSPRISVFGLGKLGACIAACFAARGFDVIGVDVDATKVRLVNQGSAPVFEPGLEALMRTSGDRLVATKSAHRAVLDSDITFVIVPTPSDSDGRFSLRYVSDACEKIGRALRKKSSWHLVVITSTVMPGDTEMRLRGLVENAGDKG